MPLGILPIDLSVNNFSCSGIKLPSGCVSDTNVSASAAISAGKLIHQIAKHYQQNDAAGVVADNQYSHIVNGTTCTLAYVQAAISTPATGADRTVNVDLQRSTGGAAFSSVLSSTITFNNASTARTVVSGTVAVATLTQGDILKWVVTVAGAAGNQAIGLVAEAFYQEAAQ